MIDGKTTGAARASLGLATTFADVYRFRDFAAGFRDLRSDTLQPELPRPGTGGFRQALAPQAAGLRGRAGPAGPRPSASSSRPAPAPRPPRARAKGITMEHPAWAARARSEPCGVPKLGAHARPAPGVTHLAAVH